MPKLALVFITIVLVAITIFVIGVGLMFAIMDIAEWLKNREWQKFIPDKPDIDPEWDEFIEKMVEQKEKKNETKEGIKQNTNKEAEPELLQVGNKSSGKECHRRMGGYIQNLRH